MIIRTAQLQDYQGFLQAEIEAWRGTEVSPISFKQFETWLALHPLTNRAAPPGPTYMPQYHPAPFAAAAALEARADDLFQEGTQAKTNDDRHILSTVFFAAVLFLAAVSLRLEWQRLRIAVLAFGTIMFLGALTFVLTLPIAS